MTKTILINDTYHETRVALLEGQTVVELFIERQFRFDSAGNIYKGKVQRVLPGMQAAFVDIGLPQAAFIYVSDVIGSGCREQLPSYLIEKDSCDASGLEEEDLQESKSSVPIENLIRDGQELLVQVAKPPIGTKGARITSHISLPGRFLVLMPTSSHIGVSRKIEQESERIRLKEMVTSLRENGLGYIIRTAAEGVQEEKLAAEIKFLNNLWNSIQKKYKNVQAPVLIHKELNVSLRAVRDLLIQEAERLIIDSDTGYQEILSFLDTFMPNLKDSVNKYDGTEPIFDAYNIEGDISRALRKKVWLKSGGYIVIEHTEALVAIDVNTGRYVGKHNLEETILKTNLEAVKEIGYQVRLRDIGGIIIIDFIDMLKKTNQEKVFSALTEAFSKDRSKTHILPMSDMGLIQMTRKRTRKSLTHILCEPCFYCEGEGYMISKKTVCQNIHREILRHIHDMVGSELTLKVNPEVAELLHGEENELILLLEKIIRKRIVIYPNHKFHIEEFEIIENKDI